MLAISVLIVRYAAEAQPGWVECKLVDAWGREWLFVDKVPIFTSASLDAQSHYPQPGVIACQVVNRWQDAQGRALVTIDTETPWHIESTTGEMHFEVMPEQLTEV